MKRFLIGKKETAFSQSYIWYSLGGFLNAAQSAILLIIISRTNSQEDAGIFSIAYAIACLALTIGNFGVRNYQVTDVTEKNSFGLYFRARVLSDLLMILIICIYIIHGKLVLGYTDYKCLSIFFLGLLKLIDSIEDVFHGMYQQKGRLDVAGRCLSLRYIVFIFSFGISLLLTNNLVYSSIACFVCSFCFFVFSILATYYEISGGSKIFLKMDTGKGSFGNILKIYKECFMLCMGGFLTIYIANAPKYAIDSICDEADQACFNYIFMPVYVVSLINSFVFQPALRKIAICYEQKDKQLYDRFFVRQIIIIIVLMVIIIIAGFCIGIPIIGWLYNTNLSNYKSSFMILLVGSGFLAMEGFFSAIITLMRRQQYLVFGYALSIMFALLFFKPIVIKHGIFGASCMYTGIIMVQMTNVLFVYIVNYRKMLKN